MITLFNKIAVVCTLIEMSTCVYADFATDLLIKFPKISGATITKSFGNFYSIVKGNEVYFISDDMLIMINGEVIDLKENNSITQKLREANRPKVKISDLNLNDAIKIGSGTDKLYVFSDPDCPYCLQLENEFDKLPGVTIYVFPMPLGSLHPNSPAMAESIWCSDNKATVWHNYLTKRIKPTMANCKNPIERNLAFADKYQIAGTPAIIFEDGTVIPGAVNVAIIKAQIEKSKNK